MPVICIEGADRVGKSTLIDLLSKEFPDNSIIHFPTVEPPSYRDAMWFMEDFWSKVGEMSWGHFASRTVILDRCWPSALVYQNKPDWVDLCRLVFPIDHYVLVTVSNEEAMKRMDPHSEKVLHVADRTWSETNETYKSLTEWDLILDGERYPHDNIKLIKEMILND